MRRNLAALIGGRIKASTKAVFVFFMSLPFLMQIDAIKNFVTPIFTAHPRVATAVGSVVSISLLLHDPQIQAAFGIPEALAEPSERASAAEMQKR